MYTAYSEYGNPLKRKEDLDSLKEWVWEFGGYILDGDKLVYMMSGFEFIDRKQALEYLSKKVPEMAKNYTWDKYCECFGFCSAWNSAHDGEEIFMSEHSNDNDEVDGIYLEDDYWLYE